MPSIDLPPQIWLPPKPAIIRPAEHRATFPMPFFSPVVAGGIQTAFSTTLTGDVGDDVWAGRTHRTVLENILAGGSQIRVIIEAESAATSIADNVSIGLRDGATDTNTVATPVELLFGATSGFSILAGGTATSDWANLTTSPGNDLVFIVDFNDTSARTRFGTGVEGKYKAATDSYTSATEPASMTDADFYLGITMVEVQ